MKTTMTTDFANDTLIAEVRAAARAGLRVLDELELDWVGGGDGPNWDNSPPPPP
jgi:hypothetical protein